LNIVTLTEQPHLASDVAEWLLDEFRHALSPSYDEQVAKLLAQKAPEETFVLRRQRAGRNRQFSR
jgi:hypothetical protein